MGVIPEDWRAASLREVAQIRSGIAKNSKTTVMDPVRVHYLRVANVQDGYLDLSEMAELEVSNSELHRFSVLPGDVLMNEGGDRDKLGRGAIWRGQFEPCVHQNHVFVVRCGKHVVPEFLTLWAAGSVARKHFLIAGGQTTNLASISKSSLGHLPVALPPEGEQRAIAAALSDVDALLGGLDRLIAKKRDLREAAMQQLVTGQTRLPGFHGEWEVLNMVQNSLLKARIGWQGLTTAEYLATGTYRLVTGTDFSAGDIDWDTCPFVAAERYEQDRYIQLRAEDVLVTKDGTIGKVAFVDNLPGPATLNSGVFVIRPKVNAYQPRFLYYVLSSTVFENFLRKLAAGSTISHLYQKDFVSFEFPAPSTVAEQTAIAAILSDMDAELSALEARHDKTRALKQAMMQELLTGRTRLG
ncbi:MAG: restriction endonuclease subunit S [Burkholderiales bacterium]|nr:restriction endonuclease subunit S [Burkholderiales bacterium]